MELEVLTVGWRSGLNGHYLFCMSFTGVTDHHFLYCCQNINDPCDRFGRWILNWQEFFYTIVFQSRKIQLDLDFLSNQHKPKHADIMDGRDDTFIFEISLLTELPQDQGRDVIFRTLKELVRSSMTHPTKNITPLYKVSNF